MIHTTNDGITTIPTVRVVFDGPPFAGKTTAARALSEALGGSVVTPDEDDGRTLWFDWLAYTAGHHAGQPVRVELVTVPGQQDLAERRQHLLGWGDVVVFVANTSEAVFNDSVTAFQSLRHELEDRPETPLVVIANKRDLIDAVPMAEVVRQLGLGPGDSLIEGIAINGGGIREAFVHAVHAALEHPAQRLEATTADALLDELRSVTDASSDASSADEPGEVEPAAEEAPDPTNLTITLHAPRLNPAAIADGDAIVILSEHWRLLVEAAQGNGPLPRTDDPAEAIIVAELAAWGLLVDAAPQGQPSGEAAPATTPVEPTAEMPPEPPAPAHAPPVESAPVPEPAAFPEPAPFPAGAADGASIRF